LALAGIVQDERRPIVEAIRHEAAALGRKG
jgi:hypothetical protein